MLLYKMASFAQKTALFCPESTYCRHIRKCHHTVGTPFARPCGSDHRGVWSQATFRVLLNHGTITIAQILTIG
jgi:hypothetical protein